MAPRPVVAAATTDLYESLPEVFRLADAAQSAGTTPGDVGGDLDGGEPFDPAVDGGDPDDAPDADLDGGDPDDVLPPGDGDAGDPDDTGDTLADGGGPVFTTAAEGGYPLLRFLDLLGAQQQLVDDAVDAIDVETDDDVSALADPAAADPAWLPWLAQFVGVALDTSLPVADQRAAIAMAPSGWQAGNKASIAAAAKTALTGSRFVQVLDHRDAAGPADEWHMLLVTRADETASGPAVVAAVVDAGAKPAGVALAQTAYSSAWSAVNGAWSTRNGKTWAELQLTGL